MDAGMVAGMSRAVSPDEVVPASWLVVALEITGVGQSELGRRVGQAPGTINRYKMGRIPMSHRTWIALLAGLGLPTDWQPPAEKLAQ